MTAPCDAPVRWSVSLKGRDTPLYLCQVHKDQLAARPGLFVERVTLAPTIGASGRSAITSGCRWVDEAHGR
jgi:hypothetical protein